MIIVAGGDSFIFGTELSDASNFEHSQQTFTALLAGENEYKCVAWPGYSNSSIARTVLTEVSKTTDPFVIVSWTFPDRFEFRFTYSTRQFHSPWYSITPWTITPDPTFEPAKQPTIVTFAESYYKHVGTGEYWENYTTLKEIVYLQNYLKQHNIPYLFTCADNKFFNPQHRDQFIDVLLDQIDMDNWYMFPEGTEEYDTCQPRGFYQWAIENKYKVGHTHPLESAHADAAKLMENKFNELVTKHLQSN